MCCANKGTGMWQSLNKKWVNLKSKSQSVISLSYWQSICNSYKPLVFIWELVVKTRNFYLYSGNQWLKLHYTYCTVFLRVHANHIMELLNLWSCFILLAYYFRTMFLNMQPLLNLYLQRCLHHGSYHQ